MGLTRSFLNDGIMQFKKKFNMKVTGSTQKGLIFKPLSNSKGLRGFFTNNPFIYRRNGQFIGAAFVANDKQLTEAELEKLKKLYEIQGLSELKFFQFNESDRIFNELTTRE